MTRRLRVLHVASADLWAGAEVATFHLLRALAARGDVTVCALLLNEGELAWRLRAAGVPVHVAPEGERSFRALARTTRAHAGNADLLHAHRPKEDLLAALSGQPWVSTQHGRPERYRGLAEVRARLVRALDLVARRISAERVIAVSGEVEEWLVRRLGRGRVIGIANGIEDPAQRISPEHWSDRPLRVGVLARLVPVKEVRLAVDAVACCPGVELEIVGEGPERAALELRARAHGASRRIHFVGFEPDPLPRVARWRALLVTSRHEGNPIGVLEALALGTPVLSADLRGVRDVLGGRGGWIVQSREPAVWAARLAEILDHPTLGTSTSRVARERFAGRFTAERTAERVFAVYREAFAAAAARQPVRRPS